METVSPLDAHLGYWLRFVSNQVSHAFAARVAALGVSVAEWVVLRELLDRPLIASVLADRMGMTRGAVSKIVDRLEAKGLLGRAVEVGDRRYQALTLTEAGRALVPQLAAAADENDAAFFGHLAPAERDQLTAVLRDIVLRGGSTAVPVD